jgi:hydrogenase maturation protease
MVIGVGNPDRGDDAAGLAVIAQLRGTLPDDVALVQRDGEATGMLDVFENASLLVLVDACTSNAPAGTVHRFDAAAGPLPQNLHTASTHGFGAGAAIELARALGRLPPVAIVYAIEGRSFARGTGLSPEILSAVAEAATRVRQELEEARFSAVFWSDSLRS